jgi:hypothetical protein
MRMARESLVQRIVLTSLSLSLTMSLGACNGAKDKPSAGQPSAAAKTGQVAARAQTPADPDTAPAANEKPAEAEEDASVVLEPLKREELQNLQASDFEELDIDELVGTYSNGCENLDEGGVARSVRKTVTFTRDSGSDDFVREVAETKFNGHDCDPAKQRTRTSYKAKGVSAGERVSVEIFGGSVSSAGARKGVNKLFGALAYRMELELTELNGKESVSRMRGFSSILPIRVKDRKQLLDITTFSNVWTDASGQLREQDAFATYQARGWLHFLNFEVARLVKGAGDQHPRKKTEAEPEATSEAAPTPSESPSPAPSPSLTPTPEPSPSPSPSAEAPVAE